MIEIRTGLLVVGLCLFFLQRATAQQQHQDCNPVDSTALSVSHDPDGDWVVLERNRAIVGFFTTKQDADRALVLVKHSQAQCFIGRRSTLQRIAGSTLLSIGFQRRVFWCGDSG